jgi:hypothetical protein
MLTITVSADHTPPPDKRDELRCHRCYRRRKNRSVRRRMEVAARSISALHANGPHTRTRVIPDNVGKSISPCLDENMTGAAGRRHFLCSRHWTLIKHKERQQNEKPSHLMIIQYPYCTRTQQAGAISLLFISALDVTRNIDVMHEMAHM